MESHGTRPLEDPARNAPAADFAVRRSAMVEEQLGEIADSRVLAAMRAVPRHEFVPLELAREAYTNQALPIGEGQTISQPFMVAAMTAALELSGAERVLEVGAGSGYQAAVLSLLAREVFAIEWNAGLAEAAAERLALLGFANVQVIAGDGTLGWPAMSPFDAILVSAAAPAIPPPLLEQLAEGGRLVVPVGESDAQTQRRVRKRAGQLTEESLYDCRFVPLLGRHGWREPLAR